jgi:PAS domain S-box-containing protein
MERKKILVVEDESIVAEDLRRSLEKLGYSVPSVVFSGEMAINKAREENPNLVLMDIMLKGEMDGIEAAGKIHSGFNIPVVYLTAFGDENILARARITEPFGYIIKPFKERELKINIEIALYKHGLENKLKESKEFYESVLEGIVNGVWVTDKNDVIVYANKGMGAIEGLEPSQIIGVQILNNFQEVFKSYYLKAKISLQPFYYSAVPFVTKAGSNYLSGWLIPRTRDRRFNGMICTIESIPKHTQAE